MIDLCPFKIWYTRCSTPVWKLSGTKLYTAFIGLTIGAKMIGGGRPPLPEILSQTDRVGAKFEQ